MRPPVTTPHRPFDRLWQPGHPFRPRRSGGRSWCMAVALVFLSAVIASYWALTDPIRLRAMAQTYLSDLVGGQVSVGSASLSLLQGLQLADVTVRADGATSADAVVFRAESIEIGYDPASLLRGRLEATRIVATGPRVTVVESVATGGWNFQRLRPRRVPATTASPARDASVKPLPLPTVVLRDARIDYAELSTDGRLVPRGSVDVEGRVFPSANADQYRFELQSRGAVQGVGPILAGQVQLRGASAGQVDATLAHFRFGEDVEAMLPRPVRAFWQNHQLRGAVDIPEFSYAPAAGRRPASFKVRTRLSHVQLVIAAAELDPAPRPAGGAVPPPIAVDDVSGEYVFDPAGVRFDDVRGSLLGNTVSATGTVAGYSPDAAVHVRVQTPAGQPLVLSPELSYLPSLPQPVRDAYAQLKPSGTASLWVQLDRPAGRGKPHLSGRLTIVDGAFTSVFFPYPVRHATGVVAIETDERQGGERIDLIDIRGQGMADGPNADRHVRVDGWVGPLDPRVGCGLTVAGTDFSADAPLLAALPPPVRSALAAFQGPAGEPVPTARGDVTVHVDMPVGIGTRAVVTADLDAHDGAGRLVDFPYPLHHLTGHVHVGDGFVELNDVRGHQGVATVVANGRVSWTTGPCPADIRPDLSLVAQQVPVDQTLLAVLPPAAGQLIRQAGILGRLDVAGHITGPGPSEPSCQFGPPVHYDLTVALRHATARPMSGTMTLGDVSADLHVTPSRIEVERASARAGPGTLSATGAVDLPDGGPAVARLSATAVGVELDRPLHDLLPASARSAWDLIVPTGSVDARLRCTLADETPPDYTLVLSPHELSVCPTLAPYRLDHLAGTVTVDPTHVTIADLHGRHGSATVTLDGHGMTEHPDRWDLSLSTRQMPVDADLRRAVPAAIRAALDRVAFHGRVDLDLPTLDYRGGATPDTADLDVAGVARADGASLDVGAPVNGVAGTARFAAAVRDGQLAAVRGDLDLDALTLGDRPITHLRAHLEQPAGSDTVHLTDVRADLAGGKLAGTVDLRFPPAAGGATTAPAGGYAVALAVTDADMGVIAGPGLPGGQPVRGRLSASLAVTGDWADPATRRGRGDVVVAGRDMYQIPLMLGLLEVTDLALPPSAPFDRATCRYAVVGRRVTFEQLQVRGDDLVMDGAGWLDFGSKRVRMNFTTDNPRMGNVPVLHDLWHGAKSELLQIQVRGTVGDPRVSAASLHTVTTTVDQVLRGMAADAER